MFRKALLVALAASACGVMTAPALAHHSAAGYDRDKEVVLRGTIREFQWTNPHVWIQVSVPDTAGKIVEWSVENGNTMALGRQGWKKTTFKPGDHVVITVNPNKDGRPIAHFVRATLADGSALGDPPKAPAAAPAQP